MIRSTYYDDISFIYGVYLGDLDLEKLMSIYNYVITGLIFLFLQAVIWRFII